MNKLSRFVQTITKSPLLWGILGSAGFYALLHAGPPDAEIIKLIKRYFAHHPVEYMETVLFSVGLAALIIKGFDVVAQRAGLSESFFGSVPRTANPADECKAMLAQLDRLPDRRQGEYFVSRLRAALEHVRRRGVADTLDDELKYLSDLDVSRAHAGYGQFRVIVWAIPILGFLGTVIGITMALNSVDLKAPDQSMLQVLNGLGLKFDTTALALTLSMVLMFIHFYVEHGENSLLDQVDRRAQQELDGRFAVVAAGGDGQLVAMRRVAEMMLQNSEVLLRRQAELWQASVNSAAQHWNQMATEASEKVKVAMSAAVGELAQRAAVLERAVAAAGEVTRLEDALNGNLAALAGAKHFEQTVLSLAAAVNMLSARLAETPLAAPIKLEPLRRSAHAA
jgi:biopolymer transport protein ExbB/TolQ